MFCSSSHLGKTKPCLSIEPSLHRGDPDVFPGSCVHHWPVSPVPSQGKEFSPGPGTSEMLTLCWSLCQLSQWIYFSISAWWLVWDAVASHTSLCQWYILTVKGFFFLVIWNASSKLCWYPSHFCFAHILKCAFSSWVCHSQTAISVCNPKPKKASHFVSATVSLSQGIEASTLN